MKKICFFTDSVFNIGGIQRVVTLLCNNLIDSYDITIICQRNIEEKNRVDYGLNKKIKTLVVDNNLFINEKILFFPIKILKKSGMFNSNLKMMYYLNHGYKVVEKRKLIKFFNKEKFDYIIAEGLINCIFLSDIKEKICSPIIGCWHSSFELYTKSNSNDLIKKSLEKLDETIVLTKYDVKKIKEKFDINVKYVYNAIDSNPVNKSSLENRFLITVGRFEHVKGYERLIRAFNEFHEDDKDNWILKIIGDGPEFENMQTLINSLGINNNVILTGKLNNNEIPYSSASAYLLSSYSEGFPMTVLEAMKYGLPVIAFDIPVLHEMLPDDSTIVNQDDVNAYSNMIKKVVTDMDFRKRSGENNLLYINNFYIDKIIKKWKEILK